MQETDETGVRTLFQPCFMRTLAPPFEEWMQQDRRWKHGFGALDVRFRSLMIAKGSVSAGQVVRVEHRLALLKVVTNASPLQQLSATNPVDLLSTPDCYKSCGKIES